MLETTSSQMKATKFVVYYSYVSPTLAIAFLQNFCIHLLWNLQQVTESHMWDPKLFHFLQTFFLSSQPSGWCGTPNFLQMSLCNSYCCPLSNIYSCNDDFCANQENNLFRYGVLSHLCSHKKSEWFMWLWLWGIPVKMSHNILANHVAAPTVTHVCNHKTHDLRFVFCSGTRADEVSMLTHTYTHGTPEET